ncbi:MAG: dCTP deaminase, partial [Bacteroidota bacterium]
AHRTFMNLKDMVTNLYNRKPNAKYINRTIKPVESMMWKNQF